MEPKGSKDRVLIFFKRYPETLTPDNLLSNIFISSIIDSPISSFYHALKKVFAPVLLTNEKWNQKIDPKLQNLLNDLETGLAVSLQKNEASDEFCNSDALSSKFLFAMKFLLDCLLKIFIYWGFIASFYFSNDFQIGNDA